jgi:hypothetical protein
VAERLSSLDAGFLVLDSPDAQMHAGFVVVAGGRAGLVTKKHRSMIDGAGCMDLAHVPFDGSPNTGQLSDDLGMPEQEPSPGESMTMAVSRVAAWCPARPRQRRPKLGRSAHDRKANRPELLQ